jgi:hypothetical protein
MELRLSLLVIETTPWERFTSATPSCNLTTWIGFHQLRLTWSRTAVDLFLCGVLAIFR